MREEDVIWFAGWKGVLEVLLVAPIIYVLVILFVRLSGKRTTGQMNNFDWIVTVAMGSIVGSGIVINTVEIAEAAAAVATLIGLQYGMTMLARRGDRVGRIVKAEPRVLVCRGEVNERALTRERITEDELASALRQHGFTRLHEIEWLLLENNGAFSILTKKEAEKGLDLTVMTPEMREGRGGG